jgi:O-antigen/teichoic acid export membrane protein
VVHGRLIANASALIGTTLVTSGLGYLYWSVAARHFSPAEVGLAAAAVSSMALLGTIAVLGLGTLLIGELPRHAGGERGLILAALLVSGLTGTALGGAFALVASNLSPDLAVLDDGPHTLALFAIGVGLTAATLVLDQALVSLLRGGLQLYRNTVFALVKLTVLIALGLWLTEHRELSIYATWVLGIVVSLVALGCVGSLRHQLGGSWHPGWSLLRELRGPAMAHHAFNMSLQAPSLALPILVATLLSTTVTAYFYAAWMVANFAFVTSIALTTTLYAIGAREPARLAQKVRLVLVLSLLAGLGANAALLLGGDLVLGFFGSSYAEEASQTLTILSLGAFPTIVKNLYVAIYRVHGRVERATPLLFSGGVLQLTCAAVGAIADGLIGLSTGWLTAVCIESIVMLAPVYRAARPTDRARLPQRAKIDDRSPALAEVPALTGSELRRPNSHQFSRGEV